MRKPALILLCALVPPLARAELVAPIDRIANDAIRAGSKAGMSIAVIHHGKTILAKGYGFANLELDVPATANTLYHIDSITKHLTAGAILALVEHKKLSLDDPITNYVALPPQWSKVRIRNLLNHTSGSASYTSQPAWVPQERLDITHEEILAMIRDKPFHFDPGTKWRYNNSGFYLLGMVIEKVTGHSYGDAMRDLVFEPLGMWSTQYCGFRPLIMGRATGYELDHGKLVNAEPMSWAAPFAGGGVCSTVLDLAHYEAALEAHSLFNDQLLRAMRGVTLLPNGISIDSGFGTRIGNLAGHRMVGHTGTGGGFSSALERFPDDDLTIVVLTNSYGGSVSPLITATRIARLMFDLPEETVRDVAIPPSELGAYVGSFDSDEGGVETVASEGRIGFRPRGSSVPLSFLRYQGDSIFTFAPESNVKMILQDRKATWGLVYVGGLFMDATYRVH